jgi:hypothetical protein
MSMMINYILNFTSEWKDISNTHSKKVYPVLKLQRQSSSPESGSLTISNKAKPLILQVPWFQSPNIYAQNLTTASTMKTANINKRRNNG